MSDLKLDSLRIQNFRTFKDLTIDRLGRVNLIVGKNNVGKTALLEGVWLWGHPEYWQDLVEFLEAEFPEENGLPQREVMNRRYQVLKPHFHGFPSLSKTKTPAFTIDPGPSDDGESIVKVSLITSKNSRELISLEIPYPRIEVVAGPWVGGSAMEENSTSYVSLKDPNKSDLKYDIGESISNFVASDGMLLSDTGRFWDEAIRSDMKDHILDVIRVVEPEVRDLNWIHEPSINLTISGGGLRRVSNTREKRVPMVSLSGTDEAVPMSSLGEGTSRALWIGSALVNSQNGILLVDEIENGIHYSVQPDLWRMIFETARELDVQVFATTHSHDCVQAFQQVSGEHEEEGMLISLRRKRSDSEEIVAVPIEEEELEYAVETHTDVR